ncbi:hypothetical protein KUG47_12220 [Falsochrobactrum sp. TDYN1]|uniref:Uncharacterized protein n=1 Tax=Falsochrobactrum tianjinense TaxID=2706015 RepID=A0A949PPH8_9HYPH|nr:hypothetical protein [Falsochrobactrum sp. TDYN1]MBV2144259.1 hypothetical protein [Falsochrobactrum sp. TDYN1]
MNGPKQESNYPDRNIDCQEEMAAKLVDALDEAEAAGWGRLEAAAAMAEAAIGIHLGERGIDPNE